MEPEESQETVTYVEFLVNGTLFRQYKSVFLNYPDSMLSRLVYGYCNEAIDEEKQEIVMKPIELVGCSAEIFPIILAYYEKGVKALCGIDLKVIGHEIKKEADYFCLEELCGVLDVCSDCNQVYFYQENATCDVNTTFHVTRIPIRFIADDDFTRSLPVQFVTYGADRFKCPIFGLDNESLCVVKRGELKFGVYMNFFPVVSRLSARTVGAKVSTSELCVDFNRGNISLISADTNSDDTNVHGFILDEICIYFTVPCDQLVPVRYVCLMGDSENISFNIKYVPKGSGVTLRASTFGCELVGDLEIYGGIVDKIISNQNNEFFLNHRIFFLYHDEVSKEIVIKYSTVAGNNVSVVDTVINKKTVPIRYFPSRFSASGANFDAHEVDVGGRVRVCGYGGWIFDRGYDYSSPDFVETLSIVGGSFHFWYSTRDESFMIFDVLHDGVSEEIVLVYNTRLD